MYDVRTYVCMCVCAIGGLSLAHVLLSGDVQEEGHSEHWEWCAVTTNTPTSCTTSYLHPPTNSCTHMYTTYVRVYMCVRMCAYTHVCTHAHTHTLTCSKLHFPWIWPEWTFQIDWNCYWRQLGHSQMPKTGVRGGKGRKERGGKRRKGRKGEMWTGV